MLRVSMPRREVETLFFCMRNQSISESPVFCYNIVTCVVCVIALRLLIFSLRWLMRCLVSLYSSCNSSPARLRIIKVYGSIICSKRLPKSCPPFSGPWALKLGLSFTFLILTTPSPPTTSRSVPLLCYLHFKAFTVCLQLMDSILAYLWKVFECLTRHSQLQNTLPLA